jgi:peroxiredoxin
MRFRGRAVIVALLVLVGLYFAVTSGIRWYVSERIDATVGRSVPEFALVDLDGRRWTQADLRGRTTLLNFFRSQCPGCRQERAAIHRLASDDPARVQVISVMMDAVQGYPAEVTRRTLAGYAYQHPVLMADAAFVDAFHGAGWSHVTPVTYIVDGSGRITASLRGHQSYRTLQAAIR